MSPRHPYWGKECAVWLFVVTLRATASRCAGAACGRRLLCLSIKQRNENVKEKPAAWNYGDYGPSFRSGGVLGIMPWNAAVNVN